MTSGQHKTGAYATANLTHSSHTHERYPGMKLTCRFLLLYNVFTLSKHIMWLVQAPATARTVNHNINAYAHVHCATEGIAVVVKGIADPIYS